jgi:hypothetical protein
MPAAQPPGNPPHAYPCLRLYHRNTGSDRVLNRSRDFSGIPIALAPDYSPGIDEALLHHIGTPNM